MTPTVAHPITVLLVDDQAIVAAAVKKMLADEADIQFHYCNDPAKAIETANSVSPTVILQDLVMPDIDGLTLVKFYRANPKTAEVPLIVLSTKEEAETKAQAFATGANDYLVKLPDRLELIARIRYHSKGYIATLERNEAYRQLAEEVNQAAKYVLSLLPAPLADGRVRTEWKFVPSTQLGGDSFGYHWLDDEHLACYLLDVSGHGVGSSLLSVSAMNVLASRALPDTDFRKPEMVLAALNATFLMEKHDNKYFTIWYGVYRPADRQLVFAGGGHPPALLIGPRGLRRLESQGPMIGAIPDLPFDADTITVEPGDSLFLFSDGCFEVEQSSGTMWTIDEFLEFMAAAPATDAIDRLLAHARQLRGAAVLGDDFSMLRLWFEN
jgi:sigma-B regulation protein RsbU (phosphoserine phosphatase)